MALTRAGPSSALQICPAISKLLSLVILGHRSYTQGREGGREAPQMFTLETCLETVSFSYIFHTCLYLSWGQSILRLEAISPGLWAQTEK